MSTSYSGVNGTVGVGTGTPTSMDVTGWSADVEAAVIDTSTTADAGWEDAIYGLKKVSGSFDFLWNPAKNPMGTILSMCPGATTYPTLTLTTNTGEILTGIALISKLSVKSEIKDAIKITASFQSKGVWTMPT